MADSAANRQEAENERWTRLLASIEQDQLAAQFYRDVLKFPKVVVEGSRDLVDKYFRDGDLNVLEGSNTYARCKAVQCILEQLQPDGLAKLMRDCAKNLTEDGAGLFEKKQADGMRGAPPLVKLRWLQVFEHAGRVAEAYEKWRQLEMRERWLGILRCLRDTLERVESRCHGVGELLIELRACMETHATCERLLNEANLERQPEASAKKFAEFNAQFKMLEKQREQLEKSVQRKSEKKQTKTGLGGLKQLEKEKSRLAKELKHLQDDKQKPVDGMSELFGRILCGIGQNSRAKVNCAKLARACILHRGSCFNL